MTPKLFLASSSASRRIMLEAAGVSFTVAAPPIDEGALRSLLSDDIHNASSIAEELARAKALSVSIHQPASLVLGADQILVCENRIHNKALTEREACETLTALSGREHELISAAVIARDGVVLWHGSETARLRMRKLSSDFIAQYLASEMPEILGSVGCYRIEGRGAQLFAEIDGDHFCIRGLPLLSLLSVLRDFGIVPK